MTIRNPRKTFGIGEIVNVPIGTRTFRGKVAEDRGKIGVRGRKLYRIAVMIDGDVVNIELPEEQIRRSGGRTSRSKLLNATKVANVLRGGKKVKKPETV